MLHSGGKLRVYIAEEQQILREAYKSFFLSQHHMEVVGCSGDTSGDALVGAASTLKPTVMLLGFKVLQSNTVEQLEMVRERCPEAAMVVLSASYDTDAIKALRRFSKGSAVGCSYLLKHTVDSVEQLTQVVSSVAEGRIIIDLAVMEKLLAGQNLNTTLIEALTHREIEVLGWMAKGYQNSTIAKMLCLDLHTVERHINSIYSKLGDCPQSRDTRVRAIMLYLRAIGALPCDESSSDL